MSEDWYNLSLKSQIGHELLILIKNLYQTVCFTFCYLSFPLIHQLIRKIRLVLLKPEGIKGFQSFDTMPTLSPMTLKWRLLFQVCKWTFTLDLRPYLKIEELVRQKWQRAVQLMICFFLFSTLYRSILHLDVIELTYSHIYSCTHSVSCRHGGQRTPHQFLREQPFIFHWMTWGGEQHKHQSWSPCSLINTCSLSCRTGY